MTMRYLPRLWVLCGILLARIFSIPAISAQTPAPPPANKPPVRVHADLKPFELSPKAQGGNQVGAASRGRPVPKLYAPFLSKTYTVNPQFHWEADDPDAKVTFHLMTPDGQTVFETAATGGHLDYPASAPALKPGTTYRWTVIPADEDPFAEIPAPVSFIVVAGAERAAIASEIASLKDPAAIANVYVSHSLWYDSIQAYSALLDRTPADGNARAVRAQIYEQVPATKPLAAADWAMVH